MPTVDEPDTAKTETPKREGWRSALSTAFVLIFAPLFAIILTVFVFQSYQVEGMSMDHELQNNDRLIVSKIPRTWSRITHNAYIPERYDIIVFNSDFLGKQLIKRVIGLPGERVTISQGTVTVYNQKHPAGIAIDSDQPYAVDLPETPGDVDVTVPENQVFVLGDNRNNSEDSSEFGPISADTIVGKLAARVLPIGNLKTF